jgi:DNA-binding response OmpR family regulator
MQHGDEPAMKKALICIGEAYMQEFLTNTLSQLGFKCSVAGTTKECRTALTQEEPDLILVNEDLPGENGHAIVDYVKNNGRYETPMITLSYEPHGVTGHKVRHLQRPIRISQLRNVIEHFKIKKAIENLHQEAS